MKKTLVAEAEQLVDEMIDMYFEIKPDDEMFLEDSPDLTNEMEVIEKIIDDENRNDLELIYILCNFNYEWLPDEDFDGELEYYEKTLEKASTLIRQNPRAFKRK